MKQKQRLSEIGAHKLKQQGPKVEYSQVVKLLSTSSFRKE